MVELHFGGPGLGLQLRDAVSANPKLVPLGAERLLQTDRLLLRSDEGWASQPEGMFQYWVVRAIETTGETPPPLTREAALQAITSFRQLLDAPTMERLKVAPEPADIVLKSDLALEVRRIGLPGDGIDEPETALLQALRSVPAEPGVSEALSDARTGDELIARFSAGSEKAEVGDRASARSAQAEPEPAVKVEEPASWQRSRQRYARRRGPGR